ncbi:MAG: DUF4062 domain-containing protein [Proteobacteria bacterium]|nr:DUF4062 domain-containing protein [Pseudomonadota bacterium]
MAASSKLRVMISSRCVDPFPAGQKKTDLSAIRKELKKDIEAIELLGKKPFEVWINEETPPKGGTWDSWDVCLQAVKDCDVLIVISNGNAGWADGAGDIGICHAELMTGLSIAPAKVRLIGLDNILTKKTAEGSRNQRFQDYVAQQSLFRGGTVKTVKDLKKRVQEALHEAIVSLTQSGVREASKGKFHSGAALDWTRLDFATRQAEMVRVLRDSMLARSGSEEDGKKVFAQVDGRDILVEPHAIPASLSVGAAREMVGQPFLRDHLLADALAGKRGGPVHVIACNKNATEGQAMKLLGFPDATVVTAPFGVFVADPVQKVQFVFITNCRDEANTRHGVQRFFEWLNQTGEESLMAERAMARARIVRAIAKEAK